MNNKVIEKSIKRALNEAPSLNFADIIETPYIKMTEHDFITRQADVKKVHYPKQFAVGFVSFAILLLCLTGWFVQYRLPDSSITLDVNPSIKIITNKKNQILTIEAINNDAEIVLEHVGERSSDLNQMVPSIIKAIINQGYLSSEKNVVMVSVENKDAEKANALAASIHQLIQTSALSQNINPQILQQTLQKDKEAATLAGIYHISDGKMRLIKRIIASNPKYTIEALASRSMEELINIATDNQVDLSDLLQAGSLPDNTTTNTASPAGMPNNGNVTSTGNRKDNSSEVNEADEDNDDEGNYDSDKEDAEQDRESEEDQDDEKEDSPSKSDSSKKYNHTAKPSYKEDEGSASPEASTDQYEDNSENDSNNDSENTENENNDNSEDDQSKATSSNMVKNDSDEEDASSDITNEASESSDDDKSSDDSSDSEASEEDNNSNNVSDND